jgi:hypothetical protein
MLEMQGRIDMPLLALVPPKPMDKAFERKALAVISRIQVVFHPSVLWRFSPCISIDTITSLYGHGVARSIPPTKSKLSSPQISPRPHYITASPLPPTAVDACLLEVIWCSCC